MTVSLTYQAYAKEKCQTTERNWSGTLEKRVLKDSMTSQKHGLTPRLTPSAISPSPTQDNAGSSEPLPFPLKQTLDNAGPSEPLPNQRVPGRFTEQDSVTKGNYGQNKPLSLSIYTASSHVPLSGWIIAGVSEEPTPATTSGHSQTVELS